MAFLNHKPCKYDLVVDHINDIKSDNRVENLQVVTHRFNSCKTQGKYASKYKGVHWIECRKRWRASIYINGKTYHLGTFKDEYEAGLAYQRKVKEIENN